MSIKSTSKTATQQIAETVEDSMSLVQLRPEQEAEMQHLYPVAKDKKHFDTLAHFVAVTNAKLNIITNLVQRIILDSPQLEDLSNYNQPQFEYGLNRILSSATGAIAQFENKLPRAEKALLGQHMGASYGAVIVPSKRYAGGMDIIHSGTPAGKSAAATAGSFNFLASWRPQVAMHSNEISSREFEISNISANIAVNAITALRMIQERIAKVSVTKENMLDGTMHQVPLDFDWTSMNNIIETIHPMFKQIKYPRFSNLDRHVVKVLQDFTTVGVRFVPSAPILTNEVNNMRHANKYYGGEQSAANSYYDHNTLMLHTTYESGIVFSLKDPFVQYITQGTDRKTMALYRWYQTWAGYYMRLSGSRIGGSAVSRPNQIPRYVTSATKLPILKEMREKFGYQVHDGDPDDNEITLMPNGLPAILPKRDDIDLNTVSEYEAELDRIQSDLYEKGVPLSVSHETLRTPFYQVKHQDLDFDETVQTEATSLSRFANICLGVDPNFNIVVHTDSTGMDSSDTRTIGAKKPSDLDVADLLGYDFAEAGESPNVRTATRYMAQMYEASVAQVGYRDGRDTLIKAAQNESGNGRLIISVTSTNIRTPDSGSEIALGKFADIAATYQYAFTAGLVPNLKTLVERAKSALGFGGLLSDSEYDNGLYSPLLNDDMTFPSQYESDIGMWLMRLMIKSMNDAAGRTGSNLMAISVRDNGSYDGAISALPNYTHYFSFASGSTMSDMIRLFNYFGAQVFSQACDALLNADRRKLFSSLVNSKTAPPSKMLTTAILPMAAMLSRIIPNALEIFERAEVEQDKTKPDLAITAADIEIPSLKEGVMLLPHQVKAHQYLRRRPRYAVLFVSAGGGKCVSFNTRVTTSDGDKTLKEIWDLGVDETLNNADVDGRFRTTDVIVQSEHGFAPASHVYRRKADRWAIVTLTDGTKFEGLPEHQFKCTKNNKSDWYQMQDMDNAVMPNGVSVAHVVLCDEPHEPFVYDLVVPDQHCYVVNGYLSHNTILGLTDIAALMKELEELGEEDIKPLIVCPTNLVGNWADDMNKILNDWNVIPITSDTVNTWGEERMYDVIKNAPRNTIFVTGLSYLSTGTFNVDIGGVRVQIRGAVEFINRFNFSYILLDESHKVKNYSGGVSGSQVHFNTKLLFTAPSVRYARLATGTLVTDRVTDVIGQAALLSPAIYGDSLEVADAGEGQVALISRTHSRMANHTAFISLKRKEWAFMLPNPIDTFISVDIDDATVPHSELHLATYEAMYQEILEALDEAAKAAKKSDDGEAEDSEASNEFGDEDELDSQDIMGKLLATDANLQIYFQRMEMLLTDPMGDDVARATFEAAGVKNFVSAKVVAIIDRIRKHFEIQNTRDEDNGDHQIYNWTAGIVPRELDLVVYEGQKYMARKQSEGYKRQMLPPSVIPPSEDPDTWKVERQGKLIVFTRYTRSANAIFNALPPEYQRVALLFHGEVGKLGQNKEANLDAFKTDDRIQILIANEQAISEGHNLQMGSRIIRCDTPWSPGVYEQSTSRIFRPDVAAADIDENGKAGDMPREVVFIDWIMTNRTLEVGKVARLMWKTVEKTQFDEKGNPLYIDINDIELDPIRMSPSLLIEMNEMRHFYPYFQAKALLNSIETAEFSQMRKTTAARMEPLTPYPPLKGFSKLDSTPWVANQHVPDPHGYGLQRLNDWCREKGFVDGDMLRKALHRQPVLTEFGYGIIVSTTVRNVLGKLRVDAPISTLRVRLIGASDNITVPATKIQIATKVDSSNMGVFEMQARTQKAQTPDERKRNDSAAEVARTVADETDKAEAKSTVRTAEKSVSVARETARTLKRKQNVADNRPINSGVEQAARTAGVRQVNSLRKLRSGIRQVLDIDSSNLQPYEPAPTMELNIHPTVYNGFVAMYANASNPNATELKNNEFVHFGEYVYIDFLYYDDYERFLDFVEQTKKMEFDAASAKRLDVILGAFEDVGRMNFNARQALKNDSQLKQFFLIRHKAAQDRKHLKVYPMVMPDRLRIMIDLTSNPRAKAWIGQKIAGTKKWGKFEYSEGMYITFTKTVTSAKARLNDLVKAGFIIKNLKTAVSELDKIKGAKKQL